MQEEVQVQIGLRLPDSKTITDKPIREVPGDGYTVLGLLPVDPADLQRR